MKKISSSNEATKTDDKFTTGCPNTVLRRDCARQRLEVESDGHDSVSAVIKKGGRNRRGRSMGRYPFLAMIPRYLKDHSSVLSEGTRKLREQRLVRIGKRMDELKRTGTISTTNPKNLTRDDALEIVSDMASNTWKPQYLRVMVENLKHYVSYCGNPTAIPEPKIGSEDRCSCFSRPPLRLWRKRRRPREQGRFRRSARARL